MADVLLRAWADLVATASVWPAIVLAFYALFLAAFLLLLAAQVGRALGVRLAARWRRRRLHVVEPPVPGLDGATEAREGHS